MSAMILRDVCDLSLSTAATLTLRTSMVVTIGITSITITGYISASAE